MEDYTFNGEDQLIKSYSLKASSLPSTIAIDVSGVKKLDFKANGLSAKIDLADVMIK